MVVDLPNIEIGQINMTNLQPEIRSSQEFRLRKFYPELPKVLVFSIPFTPSSVTTSRVENEIKVSKIRQQSFNLEIVSSYREWRGYYLAWSDLHPYQIDWGLFGGGEPLKRHEDSYLYRFSFDAQYNRPFIKSFPVFYGFQNLYTSKQIKVQMKNYNYDQSWLFFEIGKERAESRVVAGYFIVRRWECPKNYFLNSARRCHKCPTNCNVCSDSGNCARYREGRSRHQSGLNSEIFQVGSTQNFDQFNRNLSIHPSEGNNTKNTHVPVDGIFSTIFR